MNNITPSQNNKKVWQKPDIVIISSINAKHINAVHEQHYISSVTSHGHKFFLNTPNHSSFANGIANSVGQYHS